MLCRTVLSPAIPDFSFHGWYFPNKIWKWISSIKTLEGCPTYSNSSIEFNDNRNALDYYFNMVDEYNKKPKETHEDTINDVKKQHPNMVFNNYITAGDGISVVRKTI